MTSIGIGGEWLFLSCGTKLLAAHIKQEREPFVFDCSTAKKRENDPAAENKSLAGATGNDIILAFIISPSGKLVALTDDSKRLVLFQCEHSWQCVSTRWLVRRGTSLVFNKEEDEVLVADKSGDVYSFSVMQPEREGELKMGHLSMVLAVDGTLKLWEYGTGQMLQSWDLNNLEETQDWTPRLENEGKVTVCHISSSPDGCHIAVQCDRVSTIHFFMLNQENKEKELVPHSRLSLPRCPLDMTFDSEGRLWVLMDSCETMLKIYALEQGSWKCQAATSELKRVTEAFNPHWQTLDASTRATNRFEHLHKVTFDNMAEYMNKKRQRLQDQQQKKKKVEPKDNGKKARNELLEN
ncbi:tRNA (guanine-N(7)-)-methyltransferase non-catalytic subunit wdr4 isoform X2 [Festucalex cinctus]